VVPPNYQHKAYVPLYELAGTFWTYLLYSVREKYSVKEHWVPFLYLPTIYRKRDFMNEQTKKKISTKLRGRKKSATHCKHISFSLIGRKLSDQHKKNISNSMREHWRNAADES
jgi:hypothetical protein